MTDELIHTVLKFETLLGIKFERHVHVGSVLAQEIDANNKVPACIFMASNDPAKKGFYRLVDVDAAMQLKADFLDETDALFAIIKHTNVCGVAQRDTVFEAWTSALAGDPESAFGGVLIANTSVDNQTALAMNELFFEVIIAPAYSNDAIETLSGKKNRIILQQKSFIPMGKQL